MTENINITPVAPAAPATLAPSNTTDAVVRRDAIINDPALSVKYRQKDAGLVAEMRALHEIISKQGASDRLGNALTGTPPAGIEVTNDENFLTTADLTQAVKGLRKDGFADETIVEIIKGATVTQARHDEAANIRERLLRDREWIRGYRDGHSEKTMQMRRINAVIAAPIAETK
jgi:hypothetical protein